MKTNLENDDLPKACSPSSSRREEAPTLDPRDPQTPGDSSLLTSAATADDEEAVEYVPYDFGLSRRGFVQVLGAGLLITVSAASAIAQSRRGQGGGGNRAARKFTV